MDYYQILQINRKASKDEIKKAYKKLSRRYHPDNAGESGREMFEKIQRAYEILGDELKRQAYDDELVKKGQRKKNKGTQSTRQKEKVGDENLQAFYQGNYQESFASFFGFKEKKKGNANGGVSPINTDELFTSFFARNRKV